MSSSYRRLYVVLGASALFGLTAKAPADDWQFLPRLEGGGTYNDNYRLAPNAADKNRVYGPYIDAQLNASRVTPRSKLEIVPRVHSTYFPSDTADQSTDGYLDADGEYKTLRSDFTMLANYANESVILSELLPATFPGVGLGQSVGGESGRVSTRNRRQLERVVPAYTYDLSQRMHLELQGGYDHVRYQKSLFQQVGYVDYRGQGGIRFDVTQRADVRVDGVVSRFEPESGGHNTNHYGVNLQWDLQPTQIMRAYARIGADRTEAKTAVGTVGTTGITGGAGIVWTYEITQVVLDVMRDISPSAAGAEVTNDQLRFRVLHAFRPRLSGFLGVRGVRLRGASNKGVLAVDGEDYAAAETGFDYQFTESYRIEAAYDYTWQRFQADPSSAASNAVRLSLIYQPLSRFEPLPQFTGIPPGTPQTLP
jgi:hypothetical protein